MKIKSVILFLFVFIVGIVKCDGQFGQYYETSVKHYGKLIVGKTDTTLVVQDGTIMLRLNFDRGLCTLLKISNILDTKESLVNLLDSYSSMVRVDGFDLWEFIVYAEDHNKYDCVAEVVKMKGWYCVQFSIDRLNLN